MSKTYLLIVKEPRPTLLKQGYADPKHIWSCAERGWCRTNMARAPRTSVLTEHLDIFSFTILFPGGSDDKASTYNAGEVVSIPGSGRSPGKGDGNPFQYSCLENPMDGGAW